MKMVYLFNHFEVLENEHIGIRKKMYMQMKAFQDLGYDPTYIVADEAKVLIHDIANNNIEIFYFAAINSLYDFIRQKIKNINPEFIYMRYRIIYTPALYELYSNLCKENNKVICEFYTYPYDTEFSDDNLDMLIDRIYSSQLHTFIKSSTNYNAYNEIMGIPSTGIINGVNVSTLPLAKLPINKHNDFNMIAVATMHPWHGYDRIIEGIHKYYQDDGKKLLKLHLVGDGQEISKYKELVKKYQIEKNVVFHGMITNKKTLDNLYDGMDLAIGSVGMHRLSLQIVSPIKSAEYCSRGIPFVINYEDISFEKKSSFYYKATMDDSPIGINDLINFANNHRTLEMAEQMRQFAIDELSWHGQIKKVLKNIAC